MRVAYLDLGAGVAGDMLLAALVDAGAPEDAVRADLDALELPGWDLAFEEVTRAGVRARRALVTSLADGPGRGPTEIAQLIAAARLPRPVATVALRAFEALGRAEAHVHGVPLDRVHFHEVGALDAIVDIVGVASAVHALGIERVVASPLPLGSGHVATEHGVLPVPAPAVTELLKGAAVTGAGTGETVTPTGAALVVTLADGFGPAPAMTLHATGWGAGERDLDTPNAVRVLVGEASARQHDTELVIEVNLDDMNPELLPYVIERLLAAGAHDAWVTPVGMKKGRVGQSLSVLCSHEERDRVIDVIYRETTTFGLRIHEVVKEALEREWVETKVDGETVRVKVARRGPQVVTIAPEFDDAARAARATGLALKDVYAWATNAARALLDKRDRDRA